jgi:hypothetical protein
MGCGGSKRVAAATRTRTRLPDPPSNPPTPKSVRSPLEDAARDRELELEQLDAIKEDEAKNYDEVRAVVFRSRLGVRPCGIFSLTLPEIHLFGKGGREGGWMGAFNHAHTTRLFCRNYPLSLCSAVAPARRVHRPQRHCN